VAGTAVFRLHVENMVVYADIRVKARAHRWPIPLFGTNSNLPRIQKLGEFI
jgi:hypothetical protein